MKLENQSSQEAEMKIMNTSWGRGQVLGALQSSSSESPWLQGQVGPHQLHPRGIKGVESPFDDEGIKDRDREVLQEIDLEMEGEILCHTSEGMSTLQLGASFPDWVDGHEAAC